LKLYKNAIKIPSVWLRVNLLLEAFILPNMFIIVGIDMSTLCLYFIISGIMSYEKYLLGFIFLKIAL